MDPSKRKAMCGKKASFTNKGKADAIAAKFGQRVYECPICFCYHTTSKENWKDEYVTKEYMDRTLGQQENKIRAELNEKNRNLTNQVFDLHKRIKQLKEKKMANPEFEVHMLNESGIEKAQAIAYNFDCLLDDLKNICPEGRHMSIVRTKLEEASFFAKKAMASSAENQKQS